MFARLLRRQHETGGDDDGGLAPPTGRPYRRQLVGAISPTPHAEDSSPAAPASASVNAALRELLAVRVVVRPKRGRAA
jgi:hypothetical protein